MVSFVCCGKYNISMTVLEPGEYDPSSNNFLDLAGDVLEQVLKAIISAIRAGVIGPAGAYSTKPPCMG